ncbi:hypothetical protein [uncultured Clostridium sp.]|jgi:hypothetical protein|uniref:hypothetical protein n=1 Tax=uncultured Clostridium sp. TaxID=59620 RepID=UPI00262E5FE2|nr:hypothetical protein [uncultured Clostridium sp.]
MNSSNEIIFLNHKLNNYSMIQRENIGILFASDLTLRQLKKDLSLSEDENYIIQSDITMLGLDTIGNKKRFKTADGAEVSTLKGILLIEAKDITTALLHRLNGLITNASENDNLALKGIIDNRLNEVKEKLSGSLGLFENFLLQESYNIPSNTNIKICLFIDYKLTAIDEFALTGDIGLMRDEIDEYSSIFTDTKIFTNKNLSNLENLILEYQ